MSDDLKPLINLSSICYVQLQLVIKRVLKKKKRLF